jgi:di/tricarboxylate transporter
MTTDRLLALSILVGAVLAFASGRLRTDFVALLVVGALAASGLCTAAEAVSGFGSTTVVLVGSLLVVGEALARTGVAEVAGDTILRLAHGREARARLLLVLGAAAIGSFMSSTAVVALFLPVALRVADEHRRPPGALLLPLAYAALASGAMTLVATTPNLIVHAELRAAGRPGLPFFAFTPVGVVVLVGLLLLCTVAARALLPSPVAAAERTAVPRARELWSGFVGDGTLRRLHVGAASPLCGQGLRDAGIGRQFGVRVLAIERGSGRRTVLLDPTPDRTLLPGDVLVVVGPGTAFAQLAQQCGVSQLAGDGLPEGATRGIGVAVVMLHPESKLVGRTLAEANFRSQHGLHVAGVRRDGTALSDFAQQKLKAADLLLVSGPWSRIRNLRASAHDFVVLTLPAELAAVAPARAKLPLAVALVALMVVVATLGVAPMTTIAFLTALALVVTRCIDLPSVYQAMPWGTLVLIAGMLPLAGVLAKVGLLADVAAWMQATFGGAGPRVVMAVLFLVTVGLGSLVSNTATAVLMAPVALQLAAALCVEPEPFAMCVAIASICAFLTPMASPAITLVWGPGGYRQRDLLRAGLPLMLWVLLASLVLLPWLFPFTPA